MSILTIAGSPASRSRSSTLLTYAARRLAAKGHIVEEIGLHDIPAIELIEGHYAGPAAATLRARVHRAGAILISSPVYKASFSGGLKAVLDLLDQKALLGKVVLPIATGGSLAHLLAVEYGLKPVLSALGARHILAGVYATEDQVRFAPDGQALLDEELVHRLDTSVDRLAELVSPPVKAAPAYFDLGRLALNRRLSV